MGDPYVEEVATHNGPESCAGAGNGVSEALTGGAWAGLLSRERKRLRSADAVRGAEGNTGRALRRVPAGLRVVLEPWHVHRLSAREPGDPTTGQARCWPGPHSEPERVRL